MIYKMLGHCIKLKRNAITDPFWQYKNKTNIYQQHNTIIRQHNLFAIDCIQHPYFFGITVVEIIFCFVVLLLQKKSF